MKLSAFCTLIKEHPELKDAEFALADGCLCIIVPKDERRYHHVPVMPAGSNVSRESVSRRFADAIALAAEKGRPDASAEQSAEEQPVEAL